jgi:hypothetical protein
MPANTFSNTLEGIVTLNYRKLNWRPIKNIQNNSVWGPYSIFPEFGKYLIYWFRIRHLHAFDLAAGWVIPLWQEQKVCQTPIV